jgi:hypothetical protein
MICQKDRYETKEEAAMDTICGGCGRVPVQDEGERCAECLSELASYYTPDEGGNG